MRPTHLKATLIAAMIIFFSSCDDLKQKLFQAFTTGAGEFNFTVPVIPTTSKVDTIAKMNYYLNVDSLIKANTGGLFSLDMISKVYVESAELIINNPDANNNISNFDYGILIFNTYNPTKRDWNDPMAVAVDDIPNSYATSLKMGVRTDVNLKDHLKGVNLVYAYGARARKVTTKALDCTLKVKFKIE